MNVRYQVFVSSTYADLKQERQKVIQTLMEMDCIPAGMELFPAADEEQWEFIKKIIDDCDYYVLIIGGRYGSLTREGISYTEKEYDYAASIGLNVLAFVHREPGKIAVQDSDIDPTLIEKLEAFRSKVSTNRLVKFWDEAKELPGLVALSLTRAMKMSPAVGWVRASNTANDELLTDLNELRKENSSFRKQIEQLQSSASSVIPNLASLDDRYRVAVSWEQPRWSTKGTESFEVTWGNLFSLLAPYLQEHPSDGLVAYKLGQALFRLSKKETEEITVKVQEHDLQTIRVHLSALGLVRTEYSRTVRGDMALFWSLTEQGVKTMMQMRSVKASASKSEPEQDTAAQ